MLDLNIQKKVKSVVDAFFKKSKEEAIALVNETAKKNGTELTDGSKIIRVSLGNNQRIKLRAAAVEAEVDPADVFTEVLNDKGRKNIVLSEFTQNAGYTLDFRKKKRQDGSEYSAPVLKKVTA